MAMQGRAGTGESSIISPRRGASDGPQAGSGPAAGSELPAGLGPLAGLAGAWKGRGFTLVARPDSRDGTDLYLQLNLTRESFRFDPLGAVKRRGLGHDDVDLFGLTYLQRTLDAARDTVLHTEPGVWMTRPAAAPSDLAAGTHRVARMGTVPHAGALVAQGLAEAFVGPPVLTGPTGRYAFSSFPSFNSTPFPVPPTASTPPGLVFNAAGSSEARTALTVPAPPFPQYDAGVPPGPIPRGPHNPPFALNTRTPFNSEPPEAELPAVLDGLPLQEVINDPVRLLQADVSRQVQDGHTFSGTALNIATTTPLTFLVTPNSRASGPTTAVRVPQFGGGIESLLGGERPGTAGLDPGAGQEGARAAVLYATFWLEQVTHERRGHSFQQLQYAQMVVLTFPVRRLLRATPSIHVNLGWPHLSVGTLRRSLD